MLLRLLALLSMPGRGRPTGDRSPRAWAAASEPEPYPAAGQAASRCT